MEHIMYKNHTLTGLGVIASITILVSICLWFNHTQHDLKPTLSPTIEVLGKCTVCGEDILVDFAATDFNNNDKQRIRDHLTKTQICLRCSILQQRKEIW
jgi:hypothetical protein